MRVRRHNSYDTPGWVALPASLLVATLFFIPLLATLKGAVTSGTLLSSLQDPYIRKTLSFTIWQAFLSTLASLAIGLPGAWIMATYKFPGKRLVRAVSTVPYVLPSILVVLGFVIFYGNNGILNRALMTLTHTGEPPLPILYSLKAIILAHAFYNFPLVMNLVSTAWSRQDPHPAQAALTLGASRWRVFRTITLPHLASMVASSAILVFLYCYNSFSIILVLGGGPAYTTLETEIYRYAKITLQPDKAAVMALISLVVALAFMVLYLCISRLFSQPDEVSSAVRTNAKAPRGLAAVAIYAFALLAILFVLGPIVSVIWRSFTTKASLAGGNTFSLKWYRQLFGFTQANGTMGIAQDALVHSLAIALACALCSIPTSLSLVVVMRKKCMATSLLELFCMLPLAVSSVIIGLGYLFIATKLKAVGYPMVVLAHLVIAIPVCLRTLLPEARRFPQHYIDAAHTLGASSWKCFWTVELPLLRGSLITGVAFAFAMSLGELNATLTLAGRTIRTLPMVMYQLIESYNYQGACALGTILILASLLVFWLDEQLRGKESLL